MGRLRVLSGQEVCRILMEHDFVEVRQRGSHVIMQLKTEETTITVPVPNHSELKTGTLQSIIRQSELPRCLLESIKVYHALLQRVAVALKETIERMVEIDQLIPGFPIV